MREPVLLSRRNSLHHWYELLVADDRGLWHQYRASGFTPTESLVHNPLRYHHTVGDRLWHGAAAAAAYVRWQCGVHHWWWNAGGEWDP